jgi:hypothetical protein
LNKYNKIADGLASWLNFELRVGREGIFSESYMANPIGQLLNYRFNGRVVSEINHPVLAGKMEGPGKRPKVDFAIKETKHYRYEVVVETKWISKSNTLLRDIIRDIIRLDMLVPQYAEEAILIVAGKKKDFQEVFNDKNFQAHPKSHNSRELLSIDGYEKNSIRFYPIPKFREKFFQDVLEIYKENEISNSIQIERSGPFPKEANQNQYIVYLWKIRKFTDKGKFIPKILYRI